jgi:hypothetical protein
VLKYKTNHCYNGHFFSSSLHVFFFYLFVVLYCYQLDCFMDLRLLNIIWLLLLLFLSVGLDYVSELWPLMILLFRQPDYI